MTTLQHGKRYPVSIEVSFDPEGRVAWHLTVEGTDLAVSYEGMFPQEAFWRLASQGREAVLAAVSEEVELVPA